MPVNSSKISGTKYPVRQLAGCCWTNPFYFRLKWFSGTPSTWCRIQWCCFYFRIGYISVTYSFAQRRRSNLRTQVNNIEYFPPNFEGLVLGCIDADFIK